MTKFLPAVAVAVVAVLAFPAIAQTGGVAAGRAPARQRS